LRLGRQKAAKADEKGEDQAMPGTATDAAQSWRLAFDENMA